MIQFKAFAVVAAAAVGFGGGYYVRHQSAVADIAQIQKTYSDSAVEQRDQLIAQRDAYAAKAKEAIETRDRALATVRSNQCTIDEQLVQLRELEANIREAAMSTASRDRLASDACDKRLERLRGIVRAGAGLHAEAAVILGRATEALGRASASAEGYKKAVSE